MTQELIDRLRAMYVEHGTNYVQAAADRLEAQAERIKFLEADRNLEKKMRKDADEYADQLRAQLAEIATTEPVAVALRFGGDDRICLSTVFDTMDEAQDYANTCTKSKSVTVPLFTRHMPAQDVTDAARYRWLRDYLISPSTHFDDLIVSADKADTLDGVIDAAIAKGAK